MYLKHIKSGGYDYYRIMQNYRDDEGEVRQKTIMNLGRLSEEEADRTRKWVKGFPLRNPDSITTSLDVIQPVDALDEGDVSLVGQLWDLLGLTLIIDDLLSGSKRDIESSGLTKIMTVNRCLDPRSKRGIKGWYEQTILPKRMDISPDVLYPNRLYRAMDDIYDVRTKIEKKVFERLKKLFDISHDIFFYDITSSYFEGEGPKMAHYGYSRDKRPDRKQVNWGLVVTKEGFPITHEVYPGNQPDKTTVKHMSQKLKKEFGIENCVFIGDRGMISQDNIENLQRAEYDYVLAEPIKNVRELVLDTLEEEPVEEFEKVRDDLSGTEVEREEEGEKVRYLICYNPDKVEDDKEYRDRLIEKGREALEHVEGMVKRGSIKQRDIVLERIVKHLVKADADAIYNWDLPDEEKITDFSYELDKEWEEREKKLDGIWVLKTSVSKDKMDWKDLVRAYKNSRKIERVFKVIKSWNHVRPVNHWKDQRVETHIFICVLAYLLENTIEYILDEMDNPEEARNIFRDFHKIKSVKLDIDGRVKRESTEKTEVQKNILEYVDGYN